MVVEHPVEADQPCHIVELFVRDPDGQFQVGDITQVEDADRSNWQVAYLESFLDAQSCEALPVRDFERPDREEYRVAFFFHYLDLTKPLEATFGPLALPEPSPRPVYLGYMRWFPP